MVNGIINVYKEKGYTSFDVVAKLRGILKTKKIGHTGTLDPDAEGVLPVCLGKATKVCDLLTDKDKEYEAVMLLGKVTDTQDITGTVLEEKEVQVTEDEVKAAILSFVGDYMQIPPMYSALKVDGKKLCDLAREGITVERKARPVKILDIEILEINLPRVRMRVECSKGTYIRTLCEDIGAKLGCGACMESLLRTRVSSFAIADALRIAELEELVKKQAGETAPAEWNAGMFSFVDSVDSVFLHYPKTVVKRTYYKLLYNGCRLDAKMFSLAESGGTSSTDAVRGECMKDGKLVDTLGQNPFRVYDEEDNFIGIYQLSGENYKPVKIFAEL